jgi:hypothetical protein
VNFPRSSSCAFAFWGDKMTARAWAILHLRWAGILGALVLIFASPLFSSQLALGQSLQLTPSTNIVASGPQGGPFSPSTFKYNLSASNGFVKYSISNLTNWLTGDYHYHSVSAIQVVSGGCQGAEVRLTRFSD